MSTESPKGSALKQTQWRQAAESQDIDRMCVTMRNIYAQYWKIKAMIQAYADPSNGAD